MKSTWIVALAVATVLGGCSRGGQQGGAEPSRGRQLYMANCALCHGAEGRGKPALGKALTDSDFVRARTDDEMVEFLAEGRRADHPQNTKGVDMPPRGGNPALSDEDLAAIVSFLRSFD